MVAPALAIDSAVRAKTFFEDAYRAFLKAEKDNGAQCKRLYRIADRSVQMRFANSTLLPLLSPAFEHLATTSSDPTPALTMCLWDSLSTGVSMPPPAWSWDDYDVLGQVRGFESGGVHLVYQGCSNALSIFDEERALAIYWAKDNQLPYYERSAPLRAIFTWWAASQDYLLVHSAAVGKGGVGVLLTGKGGVGKSTTSLLCLQAGLEFLGDNNVILRNGSSPTAYSLYNAATLHPEQIRRMPMLAQTIQNSPPPDSPKAVFFAKELNPGQLKLSLPIKAILVPRITGKTETRLAPCSPASSLAALAPSTIFSSPGAGRSAFKFMAKYVRQVPNYILELGTDLQQIPQTVTRLLSKIS